MKKELLHFTLYVIIIYLTCGALNLDVAASPPVGGSGTHFHGVIDGQWDKQHSDQFPNRHYARTRAANLDVGEPRTVRLIYYLPNDRPYRAEVVQQMKTDILLVQDLYAEEMRLHGHGNITFRVETDPQGEPMVHRMDGGHPDSRYVGSYTEISLIVDDEIKQRFDVEANIYVALLDNSEGVTPSGGSMGKNGGLVTVANDSQWQTLAHELGHAFGLDHDFRRDNYIMSYGSSQNQLSACSAEYLSVHPYFNPNVHPEDTRPTIELISPQSYPVRGKNVSIYPAGAKNVSIKLKVSDAQGLHQVILSAETPLLFWKAAAAGFAEVKACQGLAGETDTIVEFSYDGVIPSADLTSLSIPTRHPIRITAIDVNGNTGSYSFDLELDSPESILIDNVLSTFWGIELARHEGKSVASILSERPNLGQLALSFQSNAITDLVEIVSAVSTGRPHLKRLDLDINLISDLSPLANLTDLTHLDLSTNNISDISPLSGLNRLEKLYFSDNISDISPLSGLTALTTLWLDTHLLSDISPLSGLNRLVDLRLYGNNISDLSVLTGLPRLRVLEVRGNPLSYTSINTHIPTLQARGVQVSFHERTLTRLVKMSNDLHIAPAASVPIIVEAQASDGGGFEGVPVTFTLTTGSGTLSTTFTSTDRNGRAESTLTLGTDLGTRIVEVSVPEIEPPVTFTIVGRQGVIIPDPKLRARIGQALGKTSTDRISSSEIATLTRLNASSAGISNLTGLEHASDLTSLNLSNNNISDISAVSGLTALTYLFLNGNNISDLSPLSGLTNLTHLDLYENNILDISAVSDLTDLEYLNLYENNISDISAVSGLTDLTALVLHGNNISDISALSGLTALTSLYLRGNNISNISAVSGLTALADLSLGGNNIQDRNKISDLSPLVANKGLQSGAQVDVRGNPLSYTSINTHIPTLQGRGVTVNFDSEFAYPSLLKISGDNQKGRAATALANPFVVEVEYSDGTGLAGISVTFAVTAGHGRLSAIHTTTDANGRAESTLTLGPNLGTNTVTASVNQIIKFPHPGGGRLVYTAQWQVTFNAIADTECQPEDDCLITASVEPTKELAFIMLGEIKRTALLQNFPNPFNPETWIPYRLATDADVSLSIYDLNGAVVRELDLGHQQAGYYTDRSQAAYWDGRNAVGEQVGSGVYFYQLSAGEYSATRRMVILK